MKAMIRLKLFLCFFMLLLLIELAELSVSNSTNTTSPSKQTFCTETVDCIAKIRRIASDSNRFWFGEQWKFNCGHQSGHKKSSVHCTNPRELINFYSIGSRLFRVNTFIPAYLANLRVFPRIKFVPHSGNYRACEHNFSISVEEEIKLEVNPDTTPIAPFLISAPKPPELNWPQLRPNDSLIILFLDIGFGTLKGLAVGFPTATQFIYEYEPMENGRIRQPTPFAVLVFKSEEDINWSQDFHQPKDALFDLVQFMIDYQLEDDLIGLNWFLVGGDAYSIERQRIRGQTDNCHTLIQSKLVRDRRWNFAEFFSFGSMDSSLSISAVQDHPFTLQACCGVASIEQGEIFADPLADKRLPSIVLLKPPRVTSMRSLESMDNYQRSSRHYVVLKEEKYTLVLFEPSRQYLHWMLVDIPSDALATGTLRKDYLVAEYLPPIPTSPNTCHFAVFILFLQPASVVMSSFYNVDHALRTRFCYGHCTYRSEFEIEQFASFHRLQLSAVGWVEVCYDLFEAGRQMQLLRQRSANTSESVNRRSSSARNSSYKQRLSDGPTKLSKEDAEKQMGAICLDINQQAKLEKCTIDTNKSSIYYSNNYLMSLSILLLASTLLS